MLEIIFLVCSIFSFVKKEKLLGFIFLGFTILIPAFLFLINIGLSELDEPTSISDDDIILELERENIKIDDDFEIFESISQQDLYFFRTKFKIKLSDKDFIKLRKQKSENDTLKSFVNKNNAVYDTVQIILTKDKILKFYRSQYDYNN